MKLIQERVIQNNYDKLQPIEVTLDVVIMVPARSLKEASDIVDTLSYEEMLTLALAHLEFLKERKETWTLN
jgi:dihydroneopterin aldolase